MHFITCFGVSSSAEKSKNDSPVPLAVYTSTEPPDEPCTTMFVLLLYCDTLATALCVIADGTLKRRASDMTVRVAPGFEVPKQILEASRAREIWTLINPGGRRALCGRFISSSIAELCVLRWTGVGAVVREHSGAENAEPEDCLAPNLASRALTVFIVDARRVVLNK